MRFLLLPGPYSFTHQYRLSTINNKLIKSGHKTAVCHKDPDVSLLWIGAENYPAPAFPKVSDYNESIYDLADEKLLSAYIEAEITAIESFQPDYIIADLRPTAAISAKLKRLPLISVLNATLMRNFNPHEHLDIKMRAKKSKKLREKQAYKEARILRKVSVSKGLDDLEDLFDFFNGDINWICDIPSFFNIEDLRETDHYIGPLFLESIPYLSEGFTQLFTNQFKITIYITLGNTGDLDMLPLLISTFAEDPNCFVVITTGKDQPTEQKGFVAENVYVTAYINNSFILNQADVIIHHGGSTTTYEAIYYKVPSIVMPFNTEQKLNAYAIERSQTGVVMDHNKLTEEKLYQKTQKVFQYRTLLQANMDPIKAQIEEAMDLENLISSLDESAEAVED